MLQHQKRPYWMMLKSVVTFYSFEECECMKIKYLNSGTAIWRGE